MLRGSENLGLGQTLLTPLEIGVFFSQLSSSPRVQQLDLPEKRSVVGVDKEGQSIDDDHIVKH